MTGSRRPGMRLRVLLLAAVLSLVAWTVLLRTCRAAGLVGPEAVVLALRLYRGGIRPAPGRHRPETVVPVGPFYLLTRYRHSIGARLAALGPTPAALPRWGMAA